MILPIDSAHHVDMYPSGQVDIYQSGEKVITLKAGQLLYIIQEFTQQFGGIPVTISLNDWEGIYGSNPLDK